ncbi:DUF4367 domain-containing protein [Cohnella soli]|uniref:DUF4367 domain-containing protein n=1 Tax=Cohnella soli TaxID=425005 RepID=A0ABW0HVK4_9BACL
MSKTNFEKAFDGSFDAAFENVAGDNAFAIPDHSASWNNVQKRLTARRNQTRVRSALTKLGIIVISLTAGALIFGNTEAVKAIDPVYTKIKTYPSGVIAYFFGRDSDDKAVKAKTPPPPDYLEGLKIERVDGDYVYANATRQQANQLVSFPAPTFRYVPDGYTWNEAVLIFEHQKEIADASTYTFENEKGQMISVTLRQIQPNSGSNPSISAEGVNVELIKIGDATATLTTSGRSSSIELLNKDGLYIMISGLITRDQAIRLYEGMWD